MSVLSERKQTIALDAMAKGVVTAAHLAKRAGCSERTIYCAGMACQAEGRVRRARERDVDDGGAVMRSRNDRAVIDRLRQELDDAERKAWDSLARYKFFMFGYWAAAWVRLNQIGGFKEPNPWRDLVSGARRK